MLKVKLKYYSSETNKVYALLTNNNIQIIRSNSWGDTLTCLVDDESKLMSILNVLNRGTLMGVSLFSARPTITTLLRSLTK